ncbi:hypothetical protein REPUB_Repub14bG0116900 [Reevesia pubescens]
MAVVENKFYLCCLQMAEQQKTTSSAVDSKSKEKRSVLDEEIGKDFLSSWKSMSVAQDDAMDFSFQPISKGKKKAFNFDKLDMDFNLDSDFDKLSSFKIDMPDLDFSSPSKKDGKAKEKSKEETNGGKQQEKKDRFTFSFDFNELDGFGFDSSLTKGEKTCKKSQDREAVASESSEVSKFDPALEDDCIISKFPASKDAANSKAETSKGGAEACNSIEDPCPSKAVPLQELVPGDLVAAQGSKVSPEKTADTNAKETYKSSPLSDREVSSELYDQKSLQSSPMDALSENNSNQENVSDMLAEVCCQGRRINTSSAAEDNVAEKKIMSEGSIHEKLQRKNSFPLSESDRDDRKGAAGNNPEEIDDSRSAQSEIILKDISTASLSREILDNSGAKKDIEQSAQDDIILKDISTASLSREILGNSGAKKDIEHSAQDDIVLKDIFTASLSREILDQTGAKKNLQRPTPKLPLVSSDGCSESTVSELTARKDKEAGTIRSRFFRRSEETKSQLLQASAIGEVSSFSRKKIGDIHLCPANEKREDISGSEAQNGSKLVGYSKLSSQELTKGRPLLLQTEYNIGSSSDIRGGLNADAVQNGGSKLIGKSSVQDIATTKGEPVILSSEKNARISKASIGIPGITLVVGQSFILVKLLTKLCKLVWNPCSLRVNPSNSAEKKTESGTQSSLNPILQVPKVESIQNSKFLSEAHKIAKKARALSSSKSTRIIGPNKDQMNSQRETNSLRNLEQNKDTLGITSKIVLPVRNVEKLTPKLPSLKRKTFEESNGDLLLLKPLKRLSQSPSESRDLKESSERVADEEVQNHKNHMEDSTKNILCDHLTSGSEVTREVIMTELEFPSVMESDGNVEKAEAYGKELEDICNMLKKKHEEAKEILVRAIVNNNNLLMLNHPIFKEKISFPFCTTVCYHEIFSANLRCYN